MPRGFDVRRTVSRREFTTVAAAAVAAGIGLPRGLMALFPNAREFFDWRQVGENVHVAMGGGGNAMVVLGRGRPVLVDCKSLGLGSILRREAERIGGRVGLVVNTHHHPDHSGGNSAFTGDTMLIAQSNAPERIVNAARRMLAGPQRDAERWVRGAAQNSAEAADSEDLDELREFASAAAALDPAAFTPSETFDDEYEIADAHRVIELRHITNGHTDNDVFLHLPEENVIHAGDLLFRGLHPYIDASDGASTVGWQQNLDAILALCDSETVVIPGHGPITDREGLAEQKDYFDAMREAARGAIREGKSLREILQLSPEQFTHYSVPQFRERVLRTIYGELTGH